MLHKIFLHSQDLILLHQLLRLQARLLKASIPAEDEFTKTRLKATLAPLYFLRNGKDKKLSVGEVTDWIFTRITPLNDFIKSSTTHERRGLVKEISDDIILLSNPQPKRLKASFAEAATDTPAWKEAKSQLRRFLEAFYSDWNSGLSKYLFWHNQPKYNYKRHDFLDRFYEVNSQLALCPICDGGGARAILRNRDAKAYFFTQIDHFFPKSIYPHLAMHPYNLVPVCNVCNSGSKGSIDPLALATTDLEKLALPYRSDLEPNLYITMKPVVEPIALAEGQVLKFPQTLELHAVDNDEAIQAQLDSLGTLYQIPQRWYDDMDNIGEILFRRFKQFVLSDIQTGAEFSSTWLKDRLTLLMGFTAGERQGSDPYEIIMVWWLEHFLQSLDQVDSAFFLAVKDFPDEYKGRWEAWLKRAKELRARIPLG